VHCGRIGRLPLPSNKVIKPRRPYKPADVLLTGIYKPSDKLSRLHSQAARGLPDSRQLILCKHKADPDKFLTSIDRVEALTGLDFLSVLDDAVEAGVEAEAAAGVGW